MKRTILLVTLILVSCSALRDPAAIPPDTAVTSPPRNDLSTPEPRPNPFAPKPDDEQRRRDEVFLNSASLLIRESYPPQIALSLSGNLPTPCHELRAEVSPPDQDNKISVDVYSVLEHDAVCVQVLQPLEAQIELGTYPVGHYSVWVNGQIAGEFDS